MDVRLVLASLLFLSVTATAQEKPKPVAPDAQNPAAAPAKPAAAAPGAATPGAQDPDKPAPKTTDVIGELTREKERLQTEIAYAKTRAKNANSMLASKLGQRGQSFKAIDAGTTAAAPAPAPEMRRARVMTAQELATQPKDVLLAVNGRPIRQGQFDELMNYMKSSPASGDESLRAQRVLFDLVRTESVVAALPENPAEGQVGDVMGQLESGKPIADLAKSVGTVQGAQPDGSVEVTRNSVLGPKVEQVAFSLQAGQRSRAFHTPQGIAVVQVDSIEKGASPDLDKVKAHIVQVPWQADPAVIQKAQAAAATGQLEILVRDQQVLDMLPQMWKPMAAPAASFGAGPDSELATMLDTLKQLDEAIAKAAGAESADAKAQLQQMQQQRAQVQKAIDEMRSKQDGAVDAQPVVPAAPTAPQKPGEKKK